ncbi:MAG: helicase-exonuclease AddAB subunit AddA [Lachnospiraceae bacterium]|nr:helicase-exonuclease AddAB subunit AddA [Lachnospiraceae bacterium]
MGDFKPTPAQQQVIDVRDRNILVSAAAGSGKTAVLTERIVNRLLDPVHPVSVDRLLIVTFTEAAASEMRERIAKAIAKRIAENPDNDYLRRQYTLVNSALIMTIHGFCLYLIRNHFDRIGIDPSFRVQSSEEGKILFEDSLEEAILKFRQEDEAAYEYLLDITDCEINDEKLREPIRKITGVAASQPFPAEWYRDMRILVEENGKNPENSTLLKDSLSFETETLKECLNDIKESLSEINSLLEEENKKEFDRIIAVFESDRKNVEKLLSVNTMKERSEIYKSVVSDKMPGGKMPHVDPDFRKELGMRRTSWKDRIFGSTTDSSRTDSIREIMYSCPYETFLHDEYEVSKVLLTFLTLSESLMNTYAANKRKKNVIDFSDMEHFALEILLEKEDGEYVASETALSYRNYFEEVMVDEYQDSNAIQEALLNAVANITETSGNRFMVGDVKQSIYRFRLARPEIFRKKYDEYRNLLPEEKPSDVPERDLRIDLSQNFRSREEVLKSVNRVFEDSMIRAVGEIDYDEKARLNPGAVYPENEKGADISELIVLEDDAWNGSEIKSKIAREAHAAASRISELKESGFKVADKDASGQEILRPLKYSDIVILLRKTSKRANVIKTVFESRGIPTVVLSKEGYFSTAEVQLMLNMISIIDNPLQDVPLLGVLHSFAGGFKESELAEIKFGRKHQLLYDALVAYRDEGEDRDLRKKTAKFLDRLDAYRSLSGRTGVYELLLHITEKEEIYDHFRSMRLGEVRIANLNLLLEKARDYSATGYSGIFTFLQYIESMKKKEIDFGEANLLDENADVVRIFTMHKSKGLEFPVCFLLGMGEDLTKSADRKELAIETGVGMGMDYVDSEKRVKHRTLSKNMLLYRNKIEQRGEDLRLLYVAMTRAKEKLIMVGCATGKLLENPENDGENRMFRFHEIMKANTYLNILYPEAKRNPELFGLRFFKPEELDESGTVSDIKEVNLKDLLEGTKASERVTFFTYPHTDLAKVYTKTTVSELKKAAIAATVFREEPEGEANLFSDRKSASEEAYVPLFMRDAEPVRSGSAFGNAFHRMMELLDFSDVSEILKRYHNSETAEEEAEKELLEHVNRQAGIFAGKLFLSKDEKELLNPEWIAEFLLTDYAYRMMKADSEGRLFREQRFVFSLPASRLNGNFPKEEKVLIQGVVDAYFEEEGKIVLIDYKTDHAGEEEIKRRYHTQLEYYREALEALEGKKVEEMYIYSVFHNSFIEVK